MQGSITPTGRVDQRLDFVLRERKKLVQDPTADSAAHKSKTGWADIEEAGGRVLRPGLSFWNFWK